MKTVGQRLGIGAVVGLLLIGLTPHVYGHGSRELVGPFGGELRNLTQIEGSVVCRACSLEEARKAQPEQSHLYQLTHGQDRAVLKVTTVSEPQRWEAIVFPPKLSVRGQDKLFQELIAEENLQKTVTITGLLRNTGTFDMYSLSFGG